MRGARAAEQGVDDERREGVGVLVVLVLRGRVDEGAAQDGVTGPTVGPRTIEQPEGSLPALRITLDDDTLATLDEIFPAPAPDGAKPAPEAYAR